MLGGLTSQCLLLRWILTFYLSEVEASKENCHADIAGAGGSA